MSLSFADLFKVGVGPSSSHTVGPMLAARRFVLALAREEVLKDVTSVRVELFGSLGATGRGHGSPFAVVIGLTGTSPDEIDVAAARKKFDEIVESGRLPLFAGPEIDFNLEEQVVLHKKQALKYHPNGMRFYAYGPEAELLLEREYYSIGGGFVVDPMAAEADNLKPTAVEVRYPFRTAAQLLAHCEENSLTITEVMLANEATWRTEAETRAKLLHIWQVMSDCIDAGCATEGELPGGLKVRRRAKQLVESLRRQPPNDPMLAMDWVNLYALAVNEENAAGGRVVTAPTNGAAGIVPAVLRYQLDFIGSAKEDTVVRFLLAAAAIGIIYKETASISGAEVGCQGEVGSACSMAAAGLAEVMGGTPSQVEHAAEIAMEHNLGLTCDPVGGLVQVPCIERNAIAAVKAINAARMALRGDGSHVVSLDSVIKTMRDTGMDMKVKYKETSRGGLAVNVIEC